MHVMGFRMHVAGSHQAGCSLPWVFSSTGKDRIPPFGFRGWVLCLARGAREIHTCAVRPMYVCMYIHHVCISPPFFFPSPLPHTSLFHTQIRRLARPLRWEKRARKMVSEDPNAPKPPPPLPGRLTSRTHSPGPAQSIQPRPLPQCGAAR
jgi:hypothetical protein